jgi:hypothetical protein
VNGNGKRVRLLPREEFLEIAHRTSKYEHDGRRGPNGHHQTISYATSPTPVSSLKV